MVLEMKGGWVEKGRGMFLICLILILLFFVCNLYFVFPLASMRLSHVVQETFEVRDIIKDGGEG